MNYYVRLNTDGSSLGTWKIDDTRAVRYGVTNAESTPGGFFEAEQGETVWETMKKRNGLGWDNFHPILLKPGQFHPRIARPLDAFPHQQPFHAPDAVHEENAIANAQGQLTTFTRQLERICQTIHPSTATFSSFGHDIRNLLILAATEVEAHWRGILSLNGVSKDRYSTNDYVRLKDPLKLNQYGVSFPYYPWIEPQFPFADWGKTGKPTQDLLWYDAYNAVKHDRENEFHKATLQNVFLAISACAVMLAAQFGHKHGLSQRDELAAFFRLSHVPIWETVDLYINPTAGDVWSPVPLWA